MADPHSGRWPGRPAAETLTVIEAVIQEPVMQTAAAQRTIQFPGLFARSCAEAIRPIQPIQRNVQRTYANEVRDSIMRRTRQMSGTQSHNRRVQFLAGVEVREITMDDWINANESYRPVWFG